MALRRRDGGSTLLCVASMKGTRNDFLFSEYQDKECRNGLQIGLKCFYSEFLLVCSVLDTDVLAV